MGIFFWTDNMVFLAETAFFKSAPGQFVADHHVVANPDNKRNKRKQQVRNKI